MDRRRSGSIGGRLGFATLAVVLAACSATSADAPSRSAPVVACEPDHSTPPSPLRCEPAVAAAMTALPLVHPAIARIEFNYGYACLPNSRAMKCLSPPADVGNVVITYLDRQVVMVAVRAMPGGAVSVKPPQEWDPDGIDERLLPG